MPGSSPNDADDAGLVGHSVASHMDCPAPRPSQSPNDADDDARLVGRSVASQGQMMLCAPGGAVAGTNDAYLATLWPSKAK